MSDTERDMRQLESYASGSWQAFGKSLAEAFDSLSKRAGGSS